MAELNTELNELKEVQKPRGTQGAREVHAEMLDPPYLFARKTPGAFRKDLSTAYAQAIKNGLENALDNVDALKGMDSGLSTQIRAYAHRHKDAFAALEKEGGSDAIKRALAGLADKGMSIDKAEKSIRDGLHDEIVRFVTDPKLRMDQKVTRFDKFYASMPKDAAWSRRKLQLEADAHIIEASTARAQSVLDSLLGKGKIKDIQHIDATAANKNYVGKRGVYVPPYPEGTNAWTFVTTRETKFVRVHVRETNAPGNFLLLSETEFKSLGGDAEAIRRYLRLRDKPGYVSEVRVPAGTKMAVGVIGPQPKMDLRSSSGVQFELLDRIHPTCFYNPRPIK